MLPGERRNPREPRHITESRRQSRSPHAYEKHRAPGEVTNENHFLLDIYRTNKMYKILNRMSKIEYGS